MSKILNAARTGDLLSVQRLLNEGADVAQRDQFGFSALLLAAIGGPGHSQLPVIQWLLEEGGSSIIESGHRYRGQTVWSLLMI